MFEINVPQNNRLNPPRGTRPKKIYCQKITKSWYRNFYSFHLTLDRQKSQKMIKVTFFLNIQTQLSSKSPARLPAAVSQSKISQLKKLMKGLENPNCCSQWNPGSWPKMTKQANCHELGDIRRHFQCHLIHFSHQHFNRKSIARKK